MSTTKIENSKLMTCTSCNNAEEIKEALKHNIKILVEDKGQLSGVTADEALNSIRDPKNYWTYPRSHECISKYLREMFFNGELTRSRYDGASPYVYKIAAKKLVNPDAVKVMKAMKVELTSSADTLMEEAQRLIDELGNVNQVIQDLEEMMNTFEAAKDDLLLVIEEARVISKAINS